MGGYPLEKCGGKRNWYSLVGGAIKRRLKSAAESDFVIVLYNPKGKVEDKRVKEAIETLITYRKATTPVGIATNATTEHERVRITTLGEVTSHDINSDALLIVGNSETPVFNRKMVTPRGYKKGVGY